MKKISVQYFAALREQSGKDSESIETLADSPYELYQSLKHKYNLSIPSDILRCAINDKYQDMNGKLETGDRVVFIPPVAGG